MFDGLNRVAQLENDFGTEVVDHVDNHAKIRDSLIVLREHSIKLTEG